MSSRARALLDFDLPSRISRRLTLSDIVPDRMSSRNGAIHSLPRVHNAPHRIVADLFEQGLGHFLEQTMGQDWEVHSAETPRTYPDYTLTHRRVKGLHVAVDAKTALADDRDEFSFGLGGFSYRAEPGVPHENIQLENYGEYAEHWIVGMAYRKPSKEHHAAHEVPLPDGHSALAPHEAHVVAQPVHRILDLLPQDRGSYYAPQSFPGDLSTFEAGRGVFGRLGRAAAERYYAHHKRFMAWANEVFEDAESEVTARGVRPWITFEREVLYAANPQALPEYHRHVDPDTGHLTLAPEQALDELEQIVAEVPGKTAAPEAVLRAVEKVRTLDGCAEGGLEKKCLDRLLEVARDASDQGEKPHRAALELLFAPTHLSAARLRRIYARFRDHPRVASEVGQRLRDAALWDAEADEVETTARTILKSPPNHERARSILFEHLAHHPRLGPGLLAEHDTSRTLRDCRSFEVNQQVARLAPGAERREALMRLIEIDPSGALDLLVDERRGASLGACSPDADDGLSLEHARTLLDQAAIRPGMDVDEERARLSNLLFQRGRGGLGRTVLDLSVERGLAHDAISVIQYARDEIALEDDALNATGRRLAADLPDELFMRLISRVRASSAPVADHLFALRRQVRDRLMSASTAHEAPAEEQPRSLPSPEALAQRFARGVRRGRLDAVRESLPDLVLFYPREAARALSDCDLSDLDAGPLVRSAYMQMGRYLQRAEFNEGPLAGFGLLDTLPEELLGWGVEGSSAGQGQGEPERGGEGGRPAGDAGPRDRRGRRRRRRRS